MSTPPPNTPTPLPGQWDSSIVRNIAYAALLLISTAAVDFFGVTSDVITTKGGHLIEALLGLLVVLVPLYLAYRARVTKATPPIEGTPSVQATEMREFKIATASSEATKDAAAKSPLFVGVLAIVLALATVAILPGCAGTRAAFKEAARQPDALPATAKVTAELYTAQLKEVVAIRNAGASASTVAALQAADRNAFKFVSLLRQASERYTAVTDAIKASGSATTPEELAAAQAALQKAVDDAAIAVSHLIDTLRNAQGARAISGSVPAPLLLLPALS